MMVVSVIGLIINIVNLFFKNIRLVFYFFMNTHIWIVMIAHLIKKIINMIIKNKTLKKSSFQLETKKMNINMNINMNTNMNIKMDINMNINMKMNMSMNINMKMKTNMMIMITILIIKIK
jgi:hypothetical protein